MVFKLLFIFLFSKIIVFNGKKYCQEKNGISFVLEEF